MDVIVGRVGRAHGIHGELSVELRTDEPATRFALGAVLRPEPSNRRQLTVRSARRYGDRLLVCFVEVADRTEAETLRGANLMVDVAGHERPVDPEEFYDHQLVGLVVHTTGGRRVGVVAAVEHRPGQDMLVVDADRGVHLVPFVLALVPEVDLVAGTLLVEPLPGLLDGAAETTGPGPVADQPGEGGDQPGGGADQPGGGR